MITSIPNRGFIISEIDAKEAKNIYELIATLESLVLENSEFSTGDIKAVENSEANFTSAKSAIQKG